MNHTYRLVWNQESQRYVPAPECARGKGKSSAKSKTKALAPAAVILGAVLSLPGWAQAPPANALPTGGNVVSGTANIGQSGSAMTVNQGSQKAIIDWTSFNIGKDASVTFQQNNASAIALNRVTAGDASQIHGQLNANGQVWLINPNGVVFGQGSRVDVGGLVASTMNITNADFENGNYTFQRNGATGSITNLGELTAKDGGAIALLAPTVSNDGIIRAQLGTVAMAAGDKITLQAGANGLLNVEIDPATIRTLIENKQLIVADGGQVIMTGKAADQLSASVVANTGTIQANTLQEKDGKILLIADMQHGETKAAGTLEAKFIDTSAATVSIDKDLKINTAGGEWLIDPVDITIDQSKATAIETALGTGNVTISTADGADNGSLGTNGTGTGTDAGDITVDAAITWDKATELILRADNNIAINASITAKNANGKLALLYGQGSGNGGDADYAINMSNGASVNLQSGQNFSTQKGSSGSLTTYAVVNDAAALKSAMAGSGSYALGSHLDLSGVAWAWSGSSPNLSGKFDGLGHTLKNLSITSTLGGYTGLFGTIAPNADLRHIGLVNANISVSTNTLGPVGGLAGQNLGSIRRAYVTGQISSSTSNAPGQVALVGGLVGGNLGSISDSYSTAQVTVSNATSIAAGSSFAGGLVGQNNTTGSIRRSYATGKVSVTTTGGIFAGGLVGMSSGSIDQTYAIGQVQTNKAGSIGGLVGVSVTVTNSFWDTQTTGQTTSAGGTGKTTAEMQQAATYAGWDFTKTWRIVDTGAGTEGYAFYGLPTLQGVTPKTDYQYFDSGLGTSANPWTVANWQQLQNINHGADTLAGHYRLNADLDKSSVGYSSFASATANSGAGWKPIGHNQTHSNNSRFTGQFDGQYHTIGDLVVNVTTPSNGFISIAGLFGVLDGGGQVSKLGLVNATVSASGGTNNHAGALAGVNLGGGTITQSYASGNVSAMGGLQDYAGVLVGLTYGQINQSYASGSASGTHAGVLVGQNNGTIDRSYASGALTGSNDGIVTHSFYDSSAAGSSGGTGKTAAELQQASTFADWDISANGGDNTVWRIYEGQSGPLLRGFLTPVTVTADASSITGKTYDGSAASGTATYTTNVGGAVLDGSLGYATNSKNAGDYSTADNSLTLNKNLYSGQQGYDISYAATNAELTISKKALTVENTTVAGRDYNGNQNVLAQTVKGSLAAGGVVNSDDVTLGLTSATLDSKNAGTGTATVVYGLTGDDASNYTVADTTHNNIAIGKAAITVSTDDVSKTYDGTTSVTGGVATVTEGELFGDDSVSGGTFAYTDKNAGAGNKTVTVSGVTVADGNGGGNYDVTYASNTTSTIGKAALTVTGTTAAGRDYNGSKTAAIAVGTVTGYATGESLTVTATGEFDDKNAGDRTATASYTLANGSGGGLADNYTLADTSGHAATISKKALAVTGTTAAGRAYNGSTTADVTVGTVTGYVTGESLTVTATGEFDDKNAGDRTATASYTLANGSGGGLADNYTLADTSGLTATISKKALTVTGTTAAGRAYDGSTTAAVTVGTVTGYATGESLTVTATGAFDDKNAGDRTATASYTLANGSGGGLADNYTLADTSGLTATISKKALTVTGTTAAGRAYDGSTTAAVTVGTVTGYATGESLTVTATGAFDDKNAGDRTATARYTLANGSGGSLADNYTLADTSGLTATIDKKALTVSGTTVAGRDYNGSQNVLAQTVKGSLAAGGVVDQDEVTLNLTSATLDSKNAGDRTATVAYNLSGSDASNYTVADSTHTGVTIGQKALTVSGITVDNKTYDGSTDATVREGDVALNGLVAGDQVMLHLGNATLDSKNAGSSTATVTYRLTESDASNYTVADSTHSVTIYQRALTVSGITADNKTYDGGTNATVHVDGVVLNGLVEGDKLHVSATGEFGTRNAGTGKTVHLTSSYSGDDVDNYAITGQATTTADIGRKALTITARDADKTQGETLALNGSTGFSTDGLALDETVDSVLLASAGTAAGAEAGAYDIDASAASGSNGFDADNYAITYEKGTLTVAASTGGNGGNNGGDTGGNNGGDTGGNNGGDTGGNNGGDTGGSNGGDTGGDNGGNTGGNGTAGQNTPSGGVIWLAQNLGQQSRQSGGTPGAQPGRVLPGLPAQGGTQVASSGVPHLTLTPGFIRLQDTEE